MSSSPETRRPCRLPLVITLVVWAAIGGLRILPHALPYAGQASLDSLEFSRVILDKDGGEIQVLPLAQGLRRPFVPLSRMNPALVDVVLGAEDRRFWYHSGFDSPSLIRALVQNQSAGSTVSGASTITMQLARLLNPRERTWQAKIAEIHESLQLESRLGKTGVLELYLNLVPFGRNIQGFPAAARVFFGKDLAELDREECMILAVIPRSPGAYDPWVNPARNREAAERLCRSLDPTVQAGPIPALDSACKNIQDPGRQDIWPFRAPQFVEWLKTTLEFASADTRLPLRTGLEPKLQAWLEDLLRRTVKEAARKRVSNAAAVFVRPDTMTVAAWVGSVDFHDPLHSGQVDGVTMRRQPGSTLKPFLYSLALGKGMTAASVLPDIPLDFGGQEVYTPANFNDQYNGPVRLRQALASSLNVPAVWTLQRIGVTTFTDFLIQAGFDSLKPQRGKLGLGMALGNAELSLLELVRAYGIFLHHGEFQAVRGLEGYGMDEALSGSAAQGKKGEPILNPAIADLVRDILTRHPDRTLAFGRNSNTRMHFEGAMKTGTSNQFNNIWAVGFTSDLLGGVWMGNFSGSTVQGTADSGYPARMVNKTLEAFSGHQAFPRLRGLETARICSLSGGLATPSCPFVMEEWFLPGTLPSSCTWHVGQGAAVETRYPQEYHDWLRRYRYRATGTQAQAEMRILRPQDQAVFYIDPGTPQSAQDLGLEATGSGPAQVWLDGELLTEGQFPLKVWIPLERGDHSLEIRGLDGQGQETVRRVGYEVR